MSTVNEREKAIARPIDGQHKEFAIEVRRLLGYYEGDGRPFLTSRMAAGKTGVGNVTITTMARGHRASKENIVRFAEKLGGDPEELLRLAGYIESDSMTPAHRPNGWLNVVDEAISKNEISYFPPAHPRPSRHRDVESPIDGPHKELAQEVRRILGWGGSEKSLSSRDASYRCGVNCSTIAALTRGERASPESLTKFAEGFGEDPAKLLKLAGYLKDKPTPSQPPLGWFSVADKIMERKGELEYAADTDRLTRAYNQAVPEVRAAFDALTDAVLGKE